MSKPIEHFRELCTIVHCSGEADVMQEYLVRAAEMYGYETSVDKIGNVLCRKEGSGITLQSHYDMVCIGNAPDLNLYEKEGWLHAENSTLGADNGIGMAMMLSLMQEGKVIDALFTADEEVGLLGARDLELALKTPYLLNLDSEDEGVVTIGCAGGVDIVAVLPIMTEKKKLHCFEVEVSGLPGGHSGVDIDKNIPNAIKELAARLITMPDLKLVSLQGGERRNAIAKYSTAVVASEEDTISLPGVKKLGSKMVEVVSNSEDVIAMLHGFSHGVRAYNDELGIVQTSINLAQVDSTPEKITVHLSARSMQKGLLEDLEKETVKYFESYGCEVKSEGFYAPWKPEQTAFGQEVLNVTKTVFDEAKFGAIHAGLECGIIKEKFPEIDMASIGPNIRYPHSTREKVEITSVERVFNILREIVK